MFKNTQVSLSQHTDSPSNAHEQNINRFQPSHHKFQIKISNIVELTSEASKFSRIEREIDYIKTIFCHLGVDSATISDHHRLGKFSTDRSRPRDILITLTSVWDVKKILASAHKLKTFKDKIFVSAGLSFDEQKLFKAILQKRYNLINGGAARQSIKIRSLKLYHNDKIVPIEEE